MATHNHERRAALEKKRKATEAATREKGRHTTQVASREQAIPKVTTKRKRSDNLDERKKTEVASGPQNTQKKAIKRKRATRIDQSTRKKVQIETDDTAARVRQRYQESKSTNTSQRKKAEVVSEPQTTQANASKRKRAADHPDQSPRKKVQFKNDDAAARVRQQYQEPEGMRKSRRIAGRPAESSGSLPAGQYVQVNDDDAQVSDVVLTTVIDTPVTEDTNAANEPSDPGTRGIEQHPQDFRGVFAKTIGTHRIVRGMTKERTGMTERIHVLTHGRDGLLELEHKFRRLNRDLESSEEEMEAVRSLHAKRLYQIKRAQGYVNRLTTPLRDMHATHADRNDRIYEFIGIREDHAELSFLPVEFWTAYESCITVYTACKGIKLEIHAIENELFDVLRQLDERMEASASRDDHASTREADEAENAPFGESADDQFARIRKLGGGSQRLDRLHKLWESARDKQYEEESELNHIAEEAFVAAGYLRAVDDSEEIELLRRVPSEVDEKSTGRRSGSAEPVEQDQRSNPRSPDRSALAEKVRRARRNVRYHHKRLQDARWQPLSDAGSLDSDAQGELRVRRWIKRTGELRDAEKDYRSARHRAQDEDAMSDSDQSSNFRDHISDGYAASTLKAYGYPMAEKKKNRIHSWMSPSSRHKKKQQVRQAAQAAQASDKEGSWVNHVESMGVGEDIEGRDVDRRKERIDTWEEERSRLRERGPFENAENGLHPQNSGTATDVVESSQDEEAVPMELDEDDSEDIRGSSNNPRALYNPDALTADLIDSDHQAARWIEAHFNGNGGKGRALLYDPSAPLIDYAVEGYDGENMDGIE